MDSPSNYMYVNSLKHATLALVGTLENQPTIVADKDEHIMSTALSEAGEFNRYGGGLGICGGRDRRTEGGGREGREGGGEGGRGVKTESTQTV